MRVVVWSHGRPTPRGKAVWHHAAQLQCHLTAPAPGAAMLAHSAPRRPHNAHAPPLLVEEALLVVLLLRLGKHLRHLRVLPPRVLLRRVAGRGGG